MKLFTKAINDKLYEQYHKGSELSDQMVVAKIFNPYGRGVWYLINSDPNDRDYIWAIVDLFEIESGSVSRSELEGIKVPPFGLGLERDLYFEPVNAAELLKGLLAGKSYAEGGDIKAENIVLKEDGTWFKLSEKEEKELEEKHWQENLTWQEQYEFNPQFAEGGETEGIERAKNKWQAINEAVKIKVALAIGFNQALSFLERKYVVSPYQLLERAVYADLLSTDEITKEVWDSALSEAEDIEETYKDSGQGIGSSDMTAFIKNMLNGAGLKAEFVNDRLERVNSEGEVIKIKNTILAESTFEDGGTTEVKEHQEFKMEGNHWTFEHNEEKISGTAEVKNGGVVKVNLDKPEYAGMYSNYKETILAEIKAVKN